MSMSLRDQLLQAGLVSQKQVREAERQQERQNRRSHDAKRPAGGSPGRGTTAAPAAPAAPAPPAAQKARDRVLNQAQQDKANRKALRAQIKQLLAQNPLTEEAEGQPYNFLDDNKIRRIAISAARRAALGRGELAIVRHEGYHLVTAAVAERIRERDPHAVLNLTAAADSPLDEAYKQFVVPDDLVW